MSDERIKVTFGAIDNAATDTDTAANNIYQELQDLQGYISPLVATWTGEASTNYQALQAKWNASATDLISVLHKIAQLLRTANDNYGATEKKNANIWQSLPSSH